MAARELTFDEIFHRMDDFELCNALCSAAEERYGYDFLMNWPDSVPLAHRVVHFVWSTTGFLEGEGFARFFNLECRHLAYPECFEILGLAPLAAEIRKSLALFPKCDLGDTDALISHFGSWERIEEIVSGAESELYEKSELIQSKLAGYIHAHKPEFEPLLPDIRKTRAYAKLSGKASDR